MTKCGFGILDLYPEQRKSLHVALGPNWRKYNWAQYGPDYYLIIQAPFQGIAMAAGVQQVALPHRRDCDQVGPHCNGTRCMDAQYVAPTHLKAEAISESLSINASLG